MRGPKPEPKGVDEGDCAAFGLDPDRLDDGEAGDTDTAFAVWPENWETVLAFLACSTQWRTGMAGPTGLDYAGVEALLRLNGYAGKERRELFEGLQIMEQAALSAMAKRRKS